MIPPEDVFEDYQDDKPQSTENNYKPNGDTKNAHPIHEGQPMGGQNFGRDTHTTSGDDKNNPSQNAGHSNAYFARTEPSDEHPEDTNFKVKYQDGEPDYDSAQPS